jgi:xylulokinase
MSWLGVDIGTSSCKAVLFDDGGRSLAEAYRSYDLQRPEADAAEIDAEDLKQAWRQAIGEAVAAVPSNPPRGLSISSQGEAVMLLDGAGNPIHPVLISLDHRGRQHLDRLVEQRGAETIYQRCGHAPHAMYSWSKLAWLKSAKPAVWQHIQAVHCLEDALQQDLGVEQPAMSWSLAGRSMCFEVHQHAWDDELLDQLGLTSEYLPRLLSSGAIAGTVSAAAAERFGLPAGIAVVCGGHDQGMGALGAGVSRAGEAMYATGSIECLCPAIDRLCLTPELFAANLCCYDFTLPNMATTVAFSFTGGNALQWFRDQFARDLKQAHGDRPAYDRLLESMPEAPTSLLCLPYFTPSATPYFHPQAMGAILGLDLSMERGTVLKGIQEGIALEMRLNCSLLEENGIPVHRFLATGGAARSPISTQLKADVLGRPVAALNVREAGCLGGAMLAAAAVSGNDIATVQAAMKPQAVDIDPRPMHSAHYDEQYTRYATLYQTLRDL